MRGARRDHLQHLILCVGQRFLALAVGDIGDAGPNQSLAVGRQLTKTNFTRNWVAVAVLMHPFEYRMLAFERPIDEPSTDAE